MKTLIKLALVLLLATSVRGQTNTNSILTNSTSAYPPITLAWYCDTRDYSTDLVFYVKAATNLAWPFSNWFTITNLSATNASWNAVYISNGVTNASFMVTFPNRYRALYVTVQASNALGASNSNIIYKSAPIPVVTFAQSSSNAPPWPVTNLPSVLTNDPP